MQNESLYSTPISKRTFGLEIEFADVVKSDVTLPEGFEWSKSEDGIVNNDGTRSSRTSNFGGEVNTPPLTLSHYAKDALRFVYEDIIRAGGRVTWVCSIHVHIGIDDLDLDGLKRLFALSYYTGRFIKEYSDLEEWNEESWYLPTPNLQFYEAAMNAGSMDAFWNVFVNSNKKGYMRHIVNVASYFKRKTIEFRNFNATYDVETLYNCILFAYRFVDYALTHEIEEYRRIDSMEAFLSELKIHGKAPVHVPCLVFVGDMKVYADCMIGKEVPLTSKMLKVLTDNVHTDKLATVNPALFSAELNLYKKYEVTVYNNDELNDIIYRICRENLVIHYNDNYEWIEKYNDGTPSMQLICLFLFHRLRRYTSDSEYAKKELEAYMSKLDDSIDRMTKTAEGLVDLFMHCKYVRGTVNDAIRDNVTIFYQIGNNPKARSTVHELKRNSDYRSDFEILKADYYNLVQDIPEDKTFMMLSRNDYLPMHKIARNGQVIFYSTDSPLASPPITNKLKAFQSFAVKVPADNLVIDDSSKLKICSVSPSDFYQLQEIFIKKVHKVTPPRFAFVVFYEEFCLGGFGFMYSKEDEFDMWLLSDFNTNNNVFRLSKLILLCIQSKLVKKILQRRIRSEVQTLYTKVYTQNPVSMKYRGVFNKDKQRSKPGSLIYTSEFGVVGDYDDIINTYRKMKK